MTLCFSSKNGITNLGESCSNDSELNLLGKIEFVHFLNSLHKYKYLKCFLGINLFSKYCRAGCDSSKDDIDCKPSRTLLNLGTKLKLTNLSTSFSFHEDSL